MNKKMTVELNHYIHPCRFNSNCSSETNKKDQSFTAVAGTKLQISKKEIR